MVTQNAERKYIVGMDLGGTNVRAAVTDRTGTILGDAREPSLAMSGFQTTVGQMTKTIRAAMVAAGINESQVIGVGAGIPGTINPKEGLVLWTPNFNQDWVGSNIVKPITDEFGVPMFIANDGDAAALGEFWFGSGRGVNSLVMFTLGTGIGSGTVLNGRLWVGASQGATEFGHQIIMPDGPRCGCGKFGCLEALGQISAIVTRAQRKIRQGRYSLLSDMTDDKLGELTPALIAEAASKGDSVAIETWDETGYYIGIGISNIITGLSPDMVVVGGGVSRAGDVLWKPMMRAIKANTLPQYLDVCQVLPSVLGDDVGIMGGVGLVLQEIK